jgi:hypothetical protein
LAVSRIVWPFIDPGLAMYAAALSPRTSSALPCDSSLVMPMVSRLKRTAPSTAGTEPVPPTSQDLDADAAICGTPAGKVLKVGFRPSSPHQFFSVAI